MDLFHSPGYTCGRATPLTPPGRREGWRPRWPLILYGECASARRSRRADELAKVHDAAHIEAVRWCGALPGLAESQGSPLGRRPCPRQWTRTYAEPGTVFVYRADRPDVCVVVRGGVAVTVLTRGLFRGAAA